MSLIHLSDCSTMLMQTTKSRSLEVFNFLNVPDVNDLGKTLPPIRSYKLGTLEHLEDTSMMPYMKPTPAIPFVR
jgi:hypothetical protein